jgi:hypothetical protein
MDGHCPYMLILYTAQRLQIHLLFGADPDRIGLLGKPPAAEHCIRSPPRASSCTRFLRSPRANAGMKRNECGHTQPLFRVGHDHGINEWWKPKGLRQY